MRFLQSLKPTSRTLRSDVVSGFATGLFSIPEGMAYAQLAGVNPVYGLYSGMVTTIVAAFSTGTVLMISTLTSAIALSTASVLHVAGIQKSHMPAALFTVTFLVGVTMFILGLLRLGSLVGFVSNAVMTGFVAGASMLIIIGELGEFSGYHPSGAHKIAQVIDWFANMDKWHPATLAVGIATLVLMLALKRFKKTEKMAAIITLFVMTIAVNLTGLTSVALVASIAHIPSSLPAPVLPDFSLVQDLTLGSLSVALVALVQGAGISTAYPNPDRSRANQSRDFLGEGLGNLLGSFFQSMGTGGSLSRTGISVGAGARSRWGGILAGMWLMLIVSLFGRFAELVPLAVIAGLLFVIGGELIANRIPDMRLIQRTSWGSAAAGLLTFLSALFIPLQFTIFLGAGLSLLLYIYASAESVRLRALVKDEQGRFEEVDIPETFPSNQMTILTIGGHEFYAEVSRLQELLPSAKGTRNAVIILRLRGREHISSTSLEWLMRYHDDLKDEGNILMLAGVRPHVMQVLEQTGVLEAFGRDHVFVAQPGIGASLDAASQAGEIWLKDRGL